jgi:hypothetical protein
VLKKKKKCKKTRVGAQHLGTTFFQKLWKLDQNTQFAQTKFCLGTVRWLWGPRRLVTTFSQNLNQSNQKNMETRTATPRTSYRRCTTCVWPLVKRVTGNTPTGSVLFHAQMMRLLLFSSAWLSSSPDLIMRRSRTSCRRAQAWASTQEAANRTMAHPQALQHSKEDGPAICLSACLFVPKQRSCVRLPDKDPMSYSSRFSG